MMFLVRVPGNIVGMSRRDTPPSALNASCRSSQVTSVDCHTREHLDPRGYVTDWSLLRSAWFIHSSCNRPGFRNVHVNRTHRSWWFPIRSECVTRWSAGQSLPWRSGLSAQSAHAKASEPRHIACAETVSAGSPPVQRIHAPTQLLELPSSLWKRGSRATSPFATTIASRTLASADRS